MLLLTVVVFSSCAVKRTKDSDKTLRVMLDVKNLTQSEYAAIKQALFESKHFYIVDRERAFDAIKAEQSNQYVKEPQRYDRTQKYAQIGKLYGAGGVVIATSKCQGYESMQNVAYFAFHLATVGMFDKITCTQFLELVDTATGEVMASIKNTAKKADNDVQNWSESVTMLIDAYPKYFEADSRHERLSVYQNETGLLSDAHSK